MPLIRCPKCEAICNSDQEVCHVCGHVLKAPSIQEEIKAEPVEQTIEDIKIEEPNTKDVFTSSIASSSTTKIKPTKKKGYWGYYETKYRNKYLAIVFTSLIFLVPCIIGAILFFKYIDEDPFFYLYGWGCVGMSIILGLCILRGLIKLIKLRINSAQALLDDNKHDIDNRAEGRSIAGEIVGEVAVAVIESVIDSIGN